VPRRTFSPAFPILDFPNMTTFYICTSRQNPMYRPQAPFWQASPWEHKPSSSAPCAVPMRLSRIGQHIKDEPCGKQRALLGVFSSRYSSVSRGVRSAGQFFLFTFSVSRIIRECQVPELANSDTCPRPTASGCAQFRISNSKCHCQTAALLNVLNAGTIGYRGAPRTPICMRI
jgi:hypothetical protein